MKERKAVLVLRENDEFSELIREAGIEVVNLPMIRTEPLEEQDELNKILSRLNSYDALFFTSPVAAGVFVERISPGSVSSKIYALGKRAADVLIRAGFSVDYYPVANTAEDLLDVIGIVELKGKSVLYVRGDRSIGTIPQQLSGRSEVEDIIVYRTVSADIDDRTVTEVEKKLRDGRFRWLCFFSPSAVDAFVDRFTVEDIPVAAVGPTTARRAHERRLNVAFVSPRSNATDFAAEFVAHVNGR